MKFAIMRTYMTEIVADSYEDAKAVCHDLPLSEFEVREEYVCDMESC